MQNIFMIPNLSTKDKSQARKAGLTSKYLYHHIYLWYNYFIAYRRKSAPKLENMSMLDLSDAIFYAVNENIRHYDLRFYLLNRLLSKNGRPDLCFHKMVYVDKADLYVKIKTLGGINILFLNREFQKSENSAFDAYAIVKYLAEKSTKTGNLLCATRKYINTGIKNKPLTDEMKFHHANFKSVWYYKNDPKWVKKAKGSESFYMDPFETSYKISPPTRKFTNIVDKKDYEVYFDYLLSLTRTV